MRLWNVESGALVSAWQAAPRYVDATIFAPDGHTLATVGDDHIVKVWDVATHGLRFEIPQPLDSSVGIAFSHNGQSLAVGSQDSLVLHDPTTGKVQSRLELPRSIFRVVELAFTPNDGQLITHDGYRMANFSSGFIVDQCLPFEKPITLTRAACTAMAIAPDGESIAFTYFNYKDTGHQTFHVEHLPTPYLKLK